MAKKYPVKLSKLGKAVWDLYRDLYRHARPSVDFDELYMESKNKGNPNDPVNIPYDDYYLPHDEYVGVVERHMAKNAYKLSESELDSLKFEAYLGCGPTSAEIKAD